MTLQCESIQFQANRKQYLLWSSLRDLSSSSWLWERCMQGTPPPAPPALCTDALRLELLLSDWSDDVELARLDRSVGVVGTPPGVTPCVPLEIGRFHVNTRVDFL